MDIPSQSELLFSTCGPQETACWSAPPGQVSLPSGDAIHLWKAKLDQWPDIDAFSHVLCDAETDRAGRFHQALHRHRFVAGRYLLRSILSAYLHVSKSDIRFSTGPFGKPRVELPNGSEPLQFNLSHSGGAFLLGVAGDCTIGVDIERVDAKVDFLPVARRCLAAEDAAGLERIPLRDRPGAFFAAWTLREASLKALGLGLDHLDAQRSGSTGGRDVEAWSLRNFDAERTYAAAVARVRGFES